MSEKHLWQRVLLILAVNLLALVFLYPPERKLRAGLDIAGGVSMIFEIDDTGLKDVPDLAEQMKTLLARRVDPQGIYQIQWRVLGRNRLEVQMPLPPAEAKLRQEEYRKLAEELFASNIGRGELNNALQESGEARAARLQALAARSGAPLESLQAAAARYDEYLAAVAAKNQAESPGSAPATSSAPTTQSIQLARAVRDALEAFEDARDDVLAHNFDDRRFRDVLDMDPKQKIRAEEIARFKREHPALLEKIDKVIAAYDRWKEVRGYLDGPADLRRLLRGAGVLGWRILCQEDPSNPTRWSRYVENLKKNGPRKEPEDREQWFRIDNPVQFFDVRSPQELVDYQPRGIVAAKHGSDWYVLAHTGPEYEMLGDAKRKWSLKRAWRGTDDRGRPAAHFELDAYGGDLFRKLTGANVNRQLCIFVDDVAYSHATILQAIGTSGLISGSFSDEKLGYLIRTMQAGALPTRLKDTPISERTIGSSLGETNLRLAFRAGVVGTVAVAVIMIGYYFLCGVIANVALAMNVLLVLGAMAMIGARFTLDGVAGVILSIGMAVDANVLIYERMREEKARGSSLRMIIKNGYDKAVTTIMDSNVTTLLTCVILYYVSSEEIKGFGLTLGWGIVLNLFTSVFLTRTLFLLLIKYGLMKDIRMMHLIKPPAIDWFSLRKYFLPTSAVVILIGLGALFLRGADALDIEFRGGVSAEIEVARQAGLTDAKLTEQIQKTARAIAADATKIAQARVTVDPLDSSLLHLQAPGVSTARLAAIFSEPLEEKQVVTPESRGEAQPLVVRGGVTVAGGSDAINIRPTSGVTAEQVQAAIAEVVQRLPGDARNLENSSVGSVRGTSEGDAGRFWNITTITANKKLVEHTIASAVGEALVVQPRVSYVFRGDGERPYPILDRRLEAVIPGLPPGAGEDVGEYADGAALYFDELEPPQSREVLTDRLSNMRLQPGYQDYPWRKFTVIGIQAADRDGDSQPDRDAQGRALYRSVVVAVVDENVQYRASPQDWEANFARKELQLVAATFENEQTLRKLSQFKPQIAAQSQTRALLAVLFGWVMIIGYVWLRFGKPIYGIAGVVALVHDVCIALSAIGISGWIGGADHPIGAALLIDDFKINMPIIAAILTIIGFSINDTIVIFDRVRELRGRLGVVTPKIINDAVNECMSRTILTSFTVFITILSMYLWGGPGIRGFNFCMLIGVISGTYSTVAIAAPLLLLRRQEKRSPARSGALATA